MTDVKINPYAYPGITRMVIQNSLITDFLTATANKFCIDPIKLHTQERNRHYVYPRQLAMYVLRKHTKLSLHGIGPLFKRDHATVIHAVRNIENLMDVDAAVRKDVAEVIEIFNSIKNNIHAQFTEETEPQAMGASEETVATATGPQNNQQILSNTILAQKKRKLQARASTMRRMYAKRQHRSGNLCGPHKTHKPAGSMEHPGWQIWRAIG